ncbi:MAG TPA: type VI secretion system lipoprotein TssJ [Candidatus Eisenbacteria bacterium]
MKLERYVRKAVRVVTAAVPTTLLLTLAGCSMMGKGTPKQVPVVLKMTATGALNNCGRAVPLVLHYRMIQVTDTQPLAGMKLDQLYDHEAEMLGGALSWAGPDLSIEPGATKQEAPVPVAPGAKAVVVLGNFCKTRESCFYYAFPLANATGKQYKKQILLDLTADSTCIGPTKR